MTTTAARTTIIIMIIINKVDLFTTWVKNKTKISKNMDVKNTFINKLWQTVH